MDLNMILANTNNELIRKEITSLNSYTIKFGLKLSTEEAKGLIESKNYSLKSNGRIDFTNSVLKNIIYEFCDSPYISQNNYSQTLEELVDIFYCYKNETLDYYPDDELILLMGKFFNGRCQGSLEMLSTTCLEEVARSVKLGFPIDLKEDNLYE